MATPTLSNTPTVLSGCESTSDGGTWTANSLAADSELFKENLNSLAWTARGASDTATFTPTTSKDLSNTHIRMWFLSSVANFMDLKSNGGLSVWVSDGTNTGHWYVLGSDTYQGGWVMLVVDTRRAVDEGTKPTMTAITSMGIRYVQTASPRNADNTWMDQLAYGDGYTVTGGSASDPITWQDIADQDADTSEAWGVVQKSGGVFFVNGSVELGDTGSGATGNCYFEDGGELVVFTDQAVDSDLYELRISGNATGTTSVILGQEVGSGSDSIGSGGIVLKGVQISGDTALQDINQTVGGTGRVVDNDGTSQGVAQSFQLSVAAVLKSVGLYLTSVTADTSTADTLRVWIWEDGIRKGCLGVSDPVATDALTASQINNWTFSKPPCLAASTTYYLTLEYDNPDTTTDTITVDSSGTSQITGNAYTHASPSAGEVYLPDNWTSVAASDLRMQANIVQCLRPDINVVDSDAGTPEFYGCTFLDSGQTELTITAAKLVGCAWSGCEMVTHDNGAEVRDGSIGDAVGTGIELVDPPTDPEFRDMLIQNCPVGIRLASNGDFDLRGIQFAGNDYDIEITAAWASGESVDISVLEDGDSPTIVNSGGADYTVTVSATHTLTGLQQNTEVTYVDTSDGTTVLYHVEDVDSTGETAYNYNAAVEKTADILIHHVDYVPIIIENVVLGSGGGSIPVTQQIDRVYENPT